MNINIQATPDVSTDQAPNFSNYSGDPIETPKTADLIISAKEPMISKLLQSSKLIYGLLIIIILLIIYGVITYKVFFKVNSPPVIIPHGITDLHNTNLIRQ